MVHKKYIKRNGKKFGPYYYENYRENGKIKTRYIGTSLKKHDKEKKKKPKIHVKIHHHYFLIMFILLCVILMFLAFLALT